MGRRAEPDSLVARGALSVGKVGSQKERAVRLARRARIILMAAAGAECKTIAEQLRTSRATVQLWRSAS